MIIFWRSPGVYQLPSTFWSVTLQPVGADHATIWHMKGEIHGFHMRNRRLISIHRLHRKINFGPLPFFPLVDVQSSVSHLCGTPALNADGMSVAATKGQRSRARHPRREGGRDRGEEVAREIDPAKSFRQLPPDSHESSVETAGGRAVLC